MKTLRTLFMFREWHHKLVLHAGFVLIPLGIALVIAGFADWRWLLVAWFVQVALVLVGSIGYHRLHTHRSYKTPAPFYYALLYGGHIGCYGSVPHFDLAHIWHHRYSDTERDPQQFPTLRSVFSAGYVPTMAVTYSDLRMLARRHNRIVWAFHRFYWLVILAHFLVLLAIDWKLAFYGWAMPATMAVFFGRLFNYWAHDGMKGPRNVPMWAMLFGSGEHLHENHHDNMGAWDYRKRWLDWDLGAFVIWCIMRDRPSFSDFFFVRHKTVRA